MTHPLWLFICRIVSISEADLQPCIFSFEYGHSRFGTRSSPVKVSSFKKAKELYRSIMPMHVRIEIFYPKIISPWSNVNGGDIYVT